MISLKNATIIDFEILYQLVMQQEIEKINTYEKSKEVDIKKLKLENKKLLKKYLVDNTCNYIICKSNLEVIGYLFASIDDTYINEGYLNEIFVLPNYRLQGIATKLIRKGLGWLKDNKCNTISLTVKNKNKAAIHLYKKFGFANFKDSYISMSLKI